MSTSAALPLVLTSLVPLLFTVPVSVTGAFAAAFVVVVLLDEPEELELLPHAESPSATTAIRAGATRILRMRISLGRMPRGACTGDARPWIARRSTRPRPLASLT